MITTRTRFLCGLTPWLLGLGIFLTASVASAQPCCECRCPRNEVPACSEAFGLDEDAYLAAVCQPLGCSIAVCTDKACAQANRCPRSEEGHCGDSFDNDADTLIDCDDPDCDGSDDCTGGPGSDCCASQEVAGCEIPSCESCVCGTDAFCCDVLWDFNCGALAGFQCADVCECGIPPTAEPTLGVTPTPDPTSNATPTPGESSICCSDQEVAGCEIASCESCVCGTDDFCCNEVWDLTCAATANSQCAEACECQAGPTPTPEPTSNVTPSPGGEADCCVDQEVAGCEIASCESCVCGTDSFCCDEVWDLNCAAIATSECVEPCECQAVPTGTPAPASDCCEGRDVEDGPGCSLDVCETCVCNVDSFCCNEFWDQTCADIGGAACLADCGCDTGPPQPTETPTRFRPSRAPTTPSPVPTTPVITCTGTADCPTGLLCNSSGVCVAPSPTGNGGGGGGGGCAVLPRATGHSDSFWPVLPLLLVWIAHRCRMPRRRNATGMRESCCGSGSPRPGRRSGLGADCARENDSTPRNPPR